MKKNSQQRRQKAYEHLLKILARQEQEGRAITFGQSMELNALKAKNVVDPTVDSQ